MCIEKNIELFLTTTKPNPPPSPFNQIQTQDGGLKIAPFPPHRTARVHLNEKPVSYMKLEEAQEVKKYIFDQLDSFDSCARHFLLHVTPINSLDVIVRLSPYSAYASSASNPRTIITPSGNTSALLKSLFS